MSARRFVKTAAQRRKQTRIIASFVLLAFLAILCGYFLGKYFVYRTVSAPIKNNTEEQNNDQIEASKQKVKDNEDINEDNNETEQTASENSPKTPELNLVLTPIEFYQVQVGAFSTEENGRRLLAELKDKGISGATVVFVNPYYRVRIGLLGSRQAAEKLVSSLENLNYQGFVVQRALHKNYAPQGKEEYLALNQETIKAFSALVNKLTALDFGGTSSLTSADSKELEGLINGIAEKEKTSPTLDAVSAPFRSAHEQLLATIKSAQQLKELDKNQTKVLELIENYCIFEDRLGF
jgi:cell division septation protein DedD